jgi:hypothetical protein
MPAHHVHDAKAAALTQLIAVANALEADVDARSGLSEANENFLPSTQLTAFRNAIPSKDEAQIKSLVDAIHKNIAGSTTATDQPVAPTADNIEAQHPSPQDIGLFKKALLLAVYILQTATVVGVEAAIWNIIRVQGGTSVSEPGRIGTELAAAGFVASTYPELELFTTTLAAKLDAVPSFEGQQGPIIEHIKMFLTAGGVGSSIDAGVQVANALTEKFPTSFNELMFLGYFVAFAAGGAVNAAGEIAAGNRITTASETGALPATLVQAAVDWYSRYPRFDLLLKQRIPHFVVWFAYQFYGEALANLAKAPGDGQAALWGSLWIFVLSFKLLFHWAAKIPVEKA